MSEEPVTERPMVSVVVPVKDGIRTIEARKLAFASGSVNTTFIGSAAVAVTPLNSRA